MYRLQSKQGMWGILCKLDIERAFDNVHWNFLLDMLKLIGFGGELIKWIFYCMSTVKLSIIINGSPKGIFATQKGLRPGDPLFPFLFTLVMEGLRKMLFTAEQHRWIKGFNPRIRNQWGLEMTHLVYGDDSLIFCEPEREQIYHLIDSFAVRRSVWSPHKLCKECSHYLVNESPTFRKLQISWVVKLESFQLYI